jgi:outer membrane protein TolC
MHWNSGHRERQYALKTGWAILLFCMAAGAQLAPNAPSRQSNSSSNNNAAPSFSINQSPFAGSVPEGKATSGVLPLSFKEAIDRGLRNNLGLLLQGDSMLSARGTRWKELSELLPNVNATIGETVAQQDLAAFGFRFPGIPQVIGPYNYFQAGINLTQNVFDWHALQRERGATAGVKAAQFSYKEAREMVVLAVGNAYLLTLASAARVDTSTAQVQTAQALSDKSTDQLNAGTLPAIDAYRAQVELQARHQQLIAAQNNYAKQKLSLARVIGLPTGQEFSLSETAPYEPLAAMGIDQALQRAFASRPDYQAGLAQAEAAGYYRKAAAAEHLPTLGIDGNFGDLGVNPSQSHSVYQLTGTLKIPIFEGGKAHADALQAEATLRQAKSQLEDLRGKIDYEVRTALLDLQSSAQQVEVAKVSVDLAGRTLEQARDRFTAGVTDNLEVVQAQETVASANESYISSLYSHNVAKVALARAIGYAEEGVKLYLKSK